MSRQLITHIDEFNLKAKTNYHGLQNVIFKDCDFDIEINLISGINVISFTNCTFRKNLIINTTIDRDVLFDNCVFERELNIQHVDFKGKARFRECTFNTTYFINTRFHGLADFFGSTFKETVIFYKTDFNETTVFSSAIFNENVLFTYSLINKVLILRGTKFKKGLDLSLAIISGDLSLFDLTLKDFESKNNLKEKEYELAVYAKGIIPTKNKRETFRILKKYHIDQSNPVEYHDYALQESITHRKEVFEKLKTANNWFVNFYDYVLLTLNRLSNKHVTSYWRGILFTGIVAFFFFYFSMISTEKYSVNLNPSNWTKDAFLESVKYYFISLSPVHKHTYLDALKPTTLFYVADFLGRIFVGYGIYQTIQAFTKFK